MASDYAWPCVTKPACLRCFSQRFAEKSTGKFTGWENCKIGFALPRVRVGNCLLVFLPWIPFHNISLLKKLVPCSQLEKRSSEEDHERRRIEWATWLRLSRRLETIKPSSLEILERILLRITWIWSHAVPGQTMMWQHAVRHWMKPEIAKQYWTYKSHSYPV